MNKYKYIKKIIGYLIGYYRKNTIEVVKEFIFDDSDFYKNICLECNNKCEDSNQICKLSTLYRLEKGNYVINDCVYERLANKLGKQVILNNYEIYQRIEYIRNELKQSLVDFSKTKLKKIEANIELYLNRYKKVLYVEEILSLYLSIVQYVLYGEYFDNEKGQIYLFLRDKIQLEDEKMITFLLYITDFKMLNVYGTMDVINEQCNKFYDDPLFYEAKLDSIVYTDLNKMLDGYNYLINNELSKINTLTKYQEYLLNLQLASVELNFKSYEKCYETYKNCVTLANKFDSTSKLKSGNYCCLGRTCFLLKKYDEAIQWLMEARNIKETKSIGHDYLFLFSSLEKVNKIDELNQLLDNIDMSKMVNKYGKQIVAYYKIKCNSNLTNIKNVVELENYILDLKETLDVYGSLHKNVFDDDLKHYVTITGNYKKYHLFNS